MSLADLDAVMAIEGEVYPFPWTRGNFGDSIISGYHCLVLEQAGCMIGYGVMMSGAGEAHMLNLSIAATWQRRGWGGMLLQHFIDLARKHHVRLMFLEVRQSNPGAVLLYAKAGFSQIATRKDYYPATNGREDAVVMELKL
jgi:ribosomal-protein-alanine N-acetyltransferase